MMRTLQTIAGLLLLAAALAAQAPPGAYKLAFTIQESEGGKPVGSKTYTMLVQDGTTGSIKAGNRVAVEGGQPSQWTYVDIGTNIRCTLQERESQVRLDTDVSLSLADTENRGASHQPTIRQISTNVTSLVPAGKPTTIVTLDDPASRRHYDLEVTATKVK